MKATYWIIPAVVIAGVVVWSLRQSSELDKLTKENAALKARNGEHSATGPRASAASRRKGKPSNEADWKDIAAQLAAAQDSDDEATLSGVLHAHDRVSSMTDEELAEALARIGDMKLSDEERAALEELLIDPLIEKNPQLALDKFADRIKTDEDGIGWKLSQALANWAKADLAGATRWFDQQISSGTFDSKSLDGRSELRLDYEAALVGELLAHDPAEAGRRLSGLPEDQRRDALERITFSDLPSSAQGAYADLVRGLVPADERAGAFVKIMDQLVPESGYQGVDKFFAQVNATTDEKIVAARQAAGSEITQIAGERAVTSTDVDEMRSWLQKYSPGQVNETTGRALAEAAQDGGEFSFDQASALAKQYHQQSGDDSVIVGFLESYAARSNLEEALPLAQFIKDPALRQQTLDKLQ